MSTPRCFILRHGETEWSLAGKHTGTSDIPLTENGEKRVRATGLALVGTDRLIVPERLVHIYVSPRRRAKRTLELFGLNPETPYPWHADASSSSSAPSANNSSSGSTANHERQPTTKAPVTVTPAIAEWDYGDYEGLNGAEVRERRKQNGEGGADGAWNIWTDGCPGGESPDDVIKRVDGLIREIRERHHAPALDSESAGDVLVVAHGHLLRAFAMRWMGKSLSETRFIMDAGGVGTLSYEHGSIEEPAIVLGGAFVVGHLEKRAEQEQKQGKLN